MFVCVYFLAHVYIFLIFFYVLPTIFVFGELKIHNNWFKPYINSIKFAYSHEEAIVIAFLLCEVNTFTTRTSKYCYRRVHRDSWQWLQVIVDDSRERREQSLRTRHGVRQRLRDTLPFQSTASLSARRQGHAVQWTPNDETQETTDEQPAQDGSDGRHSWTSSHPVEPQAIVCRPADHFTHRWTRASNQAS